MTPKAIPVSAPSVPERVSAVFWGLPPLTASSPMVLSPSVTMVTASSGSVTFSALKPSWRVRVFVSTSQL